MPAASHAEGGPVAAVLEVGDERPAHAVVGEQRPARVEPGGHGPRAGEGEAGRRTPRTARAPSSAAPGAPGRQQRAQQHGPTVRTGYDSHGTRPCPGRDRHTTSRGTSGSARRHPRRGWSRSPTSVANAPTARPPSGPGKWTVAPPAGSVPCPPCPSSAPSSSPAGACPAWSRASSCAGSASPSWSPPTSASPRGRCSTRASRNTRASPSAPSASSSVPSCWPPGCPLRERPGLGTVLNVLLIGTTIDLALLVIDTPDSLAVRVAYLAFGVFLWGPGTGLYIGAGLGPGTAGRPDDRARRPRRRLDPPGAHRHRAHRPRRRLAARRIGRARHRGVRRDDRPAGAVLPAPPDGRRRPSARTWPTPSGAARSAARRSRPDRQTAVNEAAPDTAARPAARTIAWPAQITRNVATTATGAHRHVSVSTTRSSVPTRLGDRLPAVEPGHPAQHDAHRAHRVHRHLGERTPAPPGPSSARNRRPSLITRA